jgi:hypothetical protein
MWHKEVYGNVMLSMLCNHPYTYMLRILKCNFIYTSNTNWWNYPLLFSLHYIVYIYPLYLPCLYYMCCILYLSMWWHVYQAWQTTKHNLEIYINYCYMKYHVFVYYGIVCSGLHYIKYVILCYCGSYCFCCLKLLLATSYGRCLSTYRIVYYYACATRTIHVV